MQKHMLETRPISEADHNFVWRVYSEVVRPMIEPHLQSGWRDEDERPKFQRIWRPAHSHVIELDGLPIGWLTVDESAPKISLQHLYIDPSFQSRGYGGRVLDGLFDKWHKAEKTVELSIFKGSRLEKFVSDRGFVAIADEGLTRLYRSK